MANLTTAATEIASQATNDPLIDELGNILTDEDVDTITTTVISAPIQLIMRMGLHA